MALILLGALIGYWIGGATGMVVGSIIGYALSYASRTVVRRGVGVQSLFLDTTFAVMGALCKADGVVTRAEIDTVEAIFLQLNLSPEQKDAAKAAFARGKAPEFDLEAEVATFTRSLGAAGVLLQLFLQLQLMAVAADGQVHPAEREMLVRVARAMGLAEQDIAQLEALLRAAASGPSQEYASASQGPPPRARLDDAYTALGVTPAATEAEIKRAYRKMISENHPDKLASQGLPKSMRELAEERARKINAAYDLIKRARNFT
jgi:DnaJ like chaperone protein